MHDLVVTGGAIVDGTGRPSFEGGLAIDDGVITAVGRGVGEGRQELDATGLVVTPGFVDVHTHYDGQVTWDPLVTPSTWHGVTTVVMGNCGVGFAPVRFDRREWLIGLMEGVEEIPGAALAEGIRWGWESFPEFLDFLQEQPLAVDVGTQVPHGALRAFVMGERGARNERAKPEDVAVMARLALEAVEAGALGISTSRTLYHRATDGERVPGTFAAEDELLALGGALGGAGHGVFEVAPAGVAGEDLDAPAKEFEWMRRLALETGRPIVFSLVQHPVEPDQWRRWLDLAAEASSAGLTIRPQVAGRPVSMLTGLQTTHAFDRHPIFREITHLPVEEQADRLRDRGVRANVLSQRRRADTGLRSVFAPDLMRTFVLGDPPDYEPAPESSIKALAERDRRDPWDLYYDLLLQDDGHELLVRPVFNYVDFDHEAIREMLLAPSSVLGLGDGGAHVGAICDASIPTSMLTHWVRDRTRGERLSLEWVVNKLTMDTASVYGLDDRGCLQPGMKADLNLIDLARLKLHRPEVLHDLPGGARRIVQRADGYVATIVSGTVVMREGTDTGARPGRLVRR